MCYMGAICVPGRPVAFTAWIDGLLGASPYATSMDALARTWRGPALCKNHGQRDGEKGLELE